MVRGGATATSAQCRTPTAPRVPCARGILLAEGRERRILRIARVFLPRARRLQRSGAEGGGQRVPVHADNRPRQGALSVERLEQMAQRGTPIRRRRRSRTGGNHMTSTCNWLRRHRLAALTATAALTALMVAPELADAGHRRHHRRANHCCCGSGGYGGYGYGGHYGHGGVRAYHGSSYGHGYAGSSYGGSTYGGSTWGRSGYADSGIRYDASRVQGQAEGQIVQDGQYSQESIRQSGQYRSDQYQSDRTRPRGLPQGDQITSNRPDLDQGVPPAPGDARSNQDGQTRGDAQQTEQL